MKRLAILGATGSIGQQTLDIVRSHPDKFQVVGLTAHTRAKELTALAAEFGVKHLALLDEFRAKEAGIPGGMTAMVDLVQRAEVDVVVVAVAGVIGLQPVVAAIEAGKQIALASKEVLVAAGELIMPMVASSGVSMTPIDSEHSAVFQCAQAAKPGQIKEVILTASGGPFRGKTRAELANVTVQQALNHPTWSMGGKITIDSATLMNKALEMIEAKWLFGIEMDRVKVVIHPQSIIHSMLVLQDESVLAQLGWPDMRLPIFHALTYPERPASGLKPWNPVETPNLTFEAVDETTFRSLELARHASALGGTAPCVMNAANEAAVSRFLSGEIGFLQITDVVERVTNLHTPVTPTLDALLDADQWARDQVEDLVRA